MIHNRVSRHIGDRPLNGKLSKCKTKFKNWTGISLSMYLPRPISKKNRESILMTKFLWQYLCYSEFGFSPKFISGHCNIFPPCTILPNCWKPQRQNKNANCSSIWSLISVFTTNCGEKVERLTKRETICKRGEMRYVKIQRVFRGNEIW